MLKGVRTPPAAVGPWPAYRPFPEARALPKCLTESRRNSDCSITPDNRRALVLPLCSTAQNQNYGQGFISGMSLEPPDVAWSERRPAAIPGSAFQGETRREDINFKRAADGGIGQVARMGVQAVQKMLVIFAGLPPALVCKRQHEGHRGVSKGYG